MISYAIMAHPARAQMVEELRADLAVPCTQVWDEGAGRWDTGYRSWSCYDRAASWHVVLQDDAVLCENFAQRAEDFLMNEAGSDRPASFYLGTGRPRQSRLLPYLAVAQEPAITMPWLIWGVALAVPTSMIDEMLEGCDMGIPNYDGRLQMYFENLRRPCTYSWPCLVDHRDEHSLVSGTVDIERRAHWFADNPRPESFRV